MELVSGLCQLISIDFLSQLFMFSRLPLSLQYAGIRIGPVVKRDVMKASIMLEHQSE